MATGACGINCDICRLNLLGVCTTCGCGKSREGRIKLETQKRILGDGCPILSCACMNQKSYCMRDCAQFPCANFETGSYPFGMPFLEMQKRRRQEWVPRIDPLGHPIEIPGELWDTLYNKNLDQLQVLTLVRADRDKRLYFDFLDLHLIVDQQARSVLVEDDTGRARELDIPLLTLTILKYLTTIDRLYPMGSDLISSKDMDNGKYFSGAHTLRKGPVLSRFGTDKKGLDQAARHLGGSALDLADLAWAFYPFPRLGVYYLFWDLETEYDPRLSILFDRCIKDIFPAPLVWELVNLTNARLLSA